MIEKIGIGEAAVILVLLYILFKEFGKKKEPRENRGREAETPEGNKPKLLELWPDFLTIPGILALIAGVLFIMERTLPADSVRWFTWEKAQSILYGTGAFFILSLISFLWVRLNFPGVFKFYAREGLKGAFTQLTPFQKWFVFLFALSLPFLALVSLFRF